MAVCECKRKSCGKSFDNDNIKRSLGEFSPVYTLGYCSAQCYTKETMEKMMSGKKRGTYTILDQARRILNDIMIQISCTMDADEIKAIKTRTARFLADTVAIDTNVPGKCTITNSKFSWILLVDGKEILFQGYDSAEYFKELYESIGYEVEFNGEPPIDV